MKTEIEKRAKYYEVICQLIFEYNEYSIIKVIFISLSLINLEDFYEGTSRKHGLIDLILSGVKLGLERKRTELTYILDCFKCLEKGNMVDISNGLIKQIKTPNYEGDNCLLKTQLIKRALSDIQKISDEDFIKEVIEYV